MHIIEFTLIPDKSFGLFIYIYIYFFFLNLLPPVNTQVPDWGGGVPIFSGHTSGMHKNKRLNEYENKKEEAPVVIVAGNFLILS